MKLILPVSNDATIGSLQRLSAQVAPGDWITISSGTVDREADPARVQSRAELLRQSFPGTNLFAFTSGAANVGRLSSQLRSPVSGIFYDYEPNYPNEPEFSFDSRVTANNLGQVTQMARAHGLALVGYLTGQALLNPKHLWNYALFRPYVDALVIQTQSALRQGRWSEAISRIEQDFGPGKPPVQISVSPGLPNAVDLDAAVNALRQLGQRAFPATVIWWIPNGFAQLQALLRVRQEAPIS